MRTVWGPTYYLTKLFIHIRVPYCLAKFQKLGKPVLVFNELLVNSNARSYITISRKSSFKCSVLTATQPLVKQNEDPLKDLVQWRENIRKYFSFNLFIWVSYTGLLNTRHVRLLVIWLMSHQQKTYWDSTFS